MNVLSLLTSRVNISLWKKFNENTVRGCSTYRSTSVIKTVSTCSQQEQWRKWWVAPVRVNPVPVVLKMIDYHHFEGTTKHHIKVYAELVGTVFTTWYNADVTSCRCEINLVVTFAWWYFVWYSITKVIRFQALVNSDWQHSLGHSLWSLNSHTLHCWAHDWHLCRADATHHLHKN